MMPRWFPDCREGVSHTTSDHSHRATDRGRDRVQDTAEENRKKNRCIRDRWMKGQRVLRSDRTCSCLKIDANHSGYTAMVSAKLQKKKKKKKWMHLL